MEESSRLFIKNLPPTINEADFRKHFTTGGREVTDIKLIAKRRIGYVGYKTPAEARKAVKFFNKSYIRMSRISVEIARPISDPSLPTAQKAQHLLNKLPTPDPEPKAKDDQADASSKKRKREDLDESDPKLREYLEVMGKGQTSSSKLEGIMGQPVGGTDLDIPMANVEEESDGEYEEIPAHKSKRQKDVPATLPTEPTAEPSLIEIAQPVFDDAVSTAQGADATDDDWLRKRTNRLLDLVDPDDLDLTPVPVHPVQPAPMDKPLASEDVNMSRVSPSLETIEKSVAEQKEDKSPIGQVRRTSRLFIRNLPFKATESELREHFAKYGDVEEVSSIFFQPDFPKHCPTRDEPQIGTAYAKAFDENPGRIF